MPQHVTKLIIMLDIDILQVDLLTKVSTSADMGNATMGNRFIPSWYLHVLSTTHESHYYWLNNHINTVTGILVITRQIWGIWKLRPAYSSETPNLGQNRWCFVPCDLEIWWMTLENNRASLLCSFKLCATFHSHQWIKTGVTVRKCPIWVKFDNF